MSLHLASLGWDDDLCSAFDNPFGKMIGIIPLVGEGRTGINAVDQVMSDGDIVTLTG